MLQPKYEVTVEINEDKYSISLFFAQMVECKVKDDLYDLITPYYDSDVSYNRKIGDKYDYFYITYNRNYDVIEVVKEIVSLLTENSYSKFFFKRGSYYSGETITDIELADIDDD